MIRHQQLTRILSLSLSLTLILKSNPNPNPNTFIEERHYTRPSYFLPITAASCAALVWLINLLIPVPEVFQDDICLDYEYKMLENTLADDDYLAEDNAHGVKHNVQVRLHPIQNPELGHGDPNSDGVALGVI